MVSDSLQMSGVSTPFGVPVRMFFRRHLERIAAQKYGAEGLQPALDRKVTARNNKAETAEALRAAARAAVVAALAADGGDEPIELGTTQFHQLGPAASAIAAFISGVPNKPGKAERKREAADAAVDAALAEAGTAAPLRKPEELPPIKTVADVERALLPALAQHRRRQVLTELCSLSGVHEAESPAIFKAFIEKDDAAVLRALAAKHAAAGTDAPAAARKSAGKRGKGYASSGESESSEEESSEEDDMEEDEAPAVDPAAPAASAADALREEARACVLAMLAQRRHKAEAQAELQEALAQLAMQVRFVELSKERSLSDAWPFLQHGCSDIAAADKITRHPAYIAFVASLEAKTARGAAKRVREDQPEEAAPPAKRALRKGGAAASPPPPPPPPREPAPSSAVVAARAIANTLILRVSKIDAALEDELNEILLDTGLSRTRACELLGVRGSMLPWGSLQINNVRYRDAYVTTGIVVEQARNIGISSGPFKAGVLKSFDDIVTRMGTTLRLKLAKGSIAERVRALDAACQNGTHDADSKRGLRSDMVHFYQTLVGWQHSGETRPNLGSAAFMIQARSSAQAVIYALTPYRPWGRKACHTASPAALAPVPRWRTRSPAAASASARTTTT